ncbi:NB-ARC domain-containing protein [Scytonema sp. PRP1]|uniref:NB-ARC domain-containing protein n=1 Tax=Scytonema sp. PRP1 TaxID=3120513 RepID=UPI002FCF1521
MSNSTGVKTILILTAIPHGLRLDKEIRSIEEAIRRAVKRDLFKITLRTAVRPTDIRRAIAEEQPQIVHFCGHGQEDGSLVLEDDGGENKPVPPSGLASLFQLHTDYVECVLLNACHSAKPAIAISEYINYAIGMNQPIGDKAAIAFAQGFYDGLGYPTPDNQDAYQRAFEEGQVAIQLEHLSEGQIPVIKTKTKDQPYKPIYKNRLPKGVPFQAPPLPAYFVERPEYSQDLKNRLLTELSDTRTLVITAIHGLGSVGKSTLAAALAHDEDVQTHFCDGILWATLGQQPDVLPLLSGWVQALGDYNFKPTSIEAATNHLRTLLYDKAVLLVVDDAWNTKDAQAFNIGGSRCQVLVTTREGMIADALGASTYSLDVMKPEQAMELLTKKLGRNLQDSERQPAADLAASLGYLPLALELAASQVMSGLSWAILLKDIQGEIARLKTFDRPGSGGNSDEASLKKLSLTASFNLSIQRLEEFERENFIWLGVLPEDASMTHKMTATLWDMDDERDASDILECLRSKALLLPGVSLLDGTRTYRLHDLLHDLARNLLTAPEKPKRRGDLLGLGLKLVDAHVTFLERYREKTKSGRWHTLPNDGYIHQRLSWHLEKAGKTEEIHSLLQEETETGGNGWYEACDRLGQNAIFVTDVARAWELAEEMFQEKPSQSIGLECRYALMTASLNSLTANVPVELLQALVKKNVWTPEQALAYTLQGSNPEQKARKLTELVDCLPLNLKELALSKALAAAKLIQDESDRARALAALADKLPQVLPEALAAAKLIQDESDRARALAALADKLPQVLPEALAAAKLIQHEYSRTMALAALADKLPQDLLPEALAAAKLIQHEEFRAEALAALADKLPQVLPEALAAAKLIQDEYNRATALAALADKLPIDLLPEALAAAKLIQAESDRATALAALADKLPIDLLPEALAAAKLIQAESDRATALAALADKLPQVLPEALAAAKLIQAESDRATALAALADKLPQDLLPEALAAAKLIQAESDRATALAALADKLPQDLLPEALAAAKLIQYETSRATALAALADKLPEVLPEALAAAKLIRDEYNRATALAALADKLPQDLLPEALAAAKLIQDEYNRATALAALADKLPEVLPEALAAAKLIQSEYNRATPLAALADKLPEVLPEALAAAKLIQHEEFRAKALAALADKLPQDLLPEALAAAKLIQHEEFRAKALAALADKLPIDLLLEALAAAKLIQDEYSRATALAALADKLPIDLLLEALAAAKLIQHKYYRARALAALADKLPEVLPEALAAAKLIQHEEFRAEALAALADKLPQVLPEALAAAKLIQDEYNRARALAALADKLPSDLLPEALAAAKLIEDEYNRATALAALADKLPEVLPEALAAAKLIQHEDSRARALAALADKLPSDLLPEALAAAKLIQHKYYRTDALAALALPLSKIPTTLLFPAWGQTLHELSLRTRQNLLKDIETLVPVIFTLGGQEAIAEVSCAISNVARWWH